MTQALDQTQTLEVRFPGPRPPVPGPDEPATHAANDLANLLAAMKGQAQLACDDPTGEEKDELVRVVLSATLKAEAILPRLQRPGPAPAPPPAKTSNGAAPSERILVVDDESAVRLLLERIFRKAGYTVVSAASAGEALEVCGRETFDLALLDVQLGDMKGTDLYREMAPRWPGIHVIFLSGDPGAADEVSRTGARQAALFVRKPFDVADLKQRVRTILDMKSALA